MENQMTVKDVLIDVTKLLNDINIPIPMVESIGIPVARAINGIQMCIDAMNRNDMEQQQAEPELQIVEAGETESNEGEENA